MQNGEFYLDPYKQNRQLSIRLVAPDFGHLDPGIVAGYDFTQRKTYYFFLLMLEGSARHSVDLQAFDIKANELLFILPHQMHQLPVAGHGTNYFKLGFDENCLSLLPKTYAFLINPLNRQKIEFSPTAAARLSVIFGILRQLLSTMDTESELILAHLNSVLTEINLAYFAADKNPANDKLATYIRFQLLVEEQLTEQPGIETIAKALALNTNGLYQLVRHYSGLSPKTFITNRLILEAKRRLYYAESSSIKELAFNLGFNDPDYFSRLFKKTTGQTVAAFLQELSG